MKLAHLSDIHAGYYTGGRVNSQGINLRLADGYLALSNMITDVIDQEVDVVLVAGDTFHSANVDGNTLIYVQNQFRRLARARIPVYILAGNHDVTDIQYEVAISRLLHDPARRIESYIAPYEVRQISDDVVLHMVSHHAFSEQAETLLKVKPVEGAMNILSSHGSVIDAETQERLHTRASPREVLIPTDLITEGFDVVLLGHIHERRFVNVNKETDSQVFYNGSLIRRGYADGLSDLERGWTLWNIDEGTGLFTPEFRTVAQRPQYDFETIEAKDLSSTEISELIVNNLKETQLDGKKEFDAATAPILRQTIKDITLAKHSALDWKAIEANSVHSFNGLPIKKVTGLDILKEENEKASEVLTSNDIMKIYDAWISDSVEMDKVDKDFKERVSKQSREFMEQGREVVFN